MNDGDHGDDDVGSGTKEDRPAPDPAQVRRLAFPQPIAPPLIELNVLGESLGRSLFAGTGLQRLIEAQASAITREVLAPVTAGLRLPVVRWDSPALREMMHRVGEPIRALIPDNLHGLRIEEWRSVIDIGVEHRIGLAWSPRLEIVRELLDMATAADREALLDRRHEDILTDCTAVVAGIEHPDVVELAGFLVRAVDAVSGGHPRGRAGAGDERLGDRTAHLAGGRTEPSRQAECPRRPPPGRQRRDDPAQSAASGQRLRDPPGLPAVSRVGPLAGLLPARHGSLRQRAALQPHERSEGHHADRVLAATAGRGDALAHRVGRLTRAAPPGRAPAGGQEYRP